MRLIAAILNRLPGRRSPAVGARGGLFGRAWLLRATAASALLAAVLRLGPMVPLPGSGSGSGSATAPSLSESPAPPPILIGFESATEAQMADALGDLLPEPGAGPEAAPAPPRSAAARSAAAAGRATESRAAEIAQELQRRREDLERREADLSLREAAVQVAEAGLGQQIERLERLRKELQTLVDQIRAANESDVTQLVKLYENMKAKNAAVVLEQLDLKTLLPLIRKMRDAKVAAVLALMDPVKAKQITAALAQPTPLPQTP